MKAVQFDAVAVLDRDFADSRFVDRERDGLGACASHEFRFFVAHYRDKWIRLEVGRVLLTIRLREDVGTS